MKILIIQLARLGDIYLSWPAIRALKRKYPTSEIHLLTRAKFANAVVGLTAINKHHVLPSEEILSPMLQEQMDIQGSFDVLSNFLDKMYSENFEQIYNFTFSPTSSYVTHYLSNSSTQVFGYTRHKDGYLSIPDDMSAYFYAQVGIGKPNRFHLIEIFASLASLDLQEEDWRAPHILQQASIELPDEYVVVHVGASEGHKCLSAEQWITFINEFKQLNSCKIVLIGSEQETTTATEIAKQHEVVDLVGKTAIHEIFSVLKKAKLLIGCDSAPMHMANFVNTVCANISFSSVNFWETGPRVLDSIIVRFRNAQEFDAKKVAVAVQRNLSGEKQDLSIIHVGTGIPSYWALTSKASDFEWLLLRAIYLSEDFPSNEDKDFKEAVRHLSDVNTLMLEQMGNVERTGDVAKASPFIERGEEIIETIGKLVPTTQALIRWYQTEKIRIPPAEMKTVLSRTIEIHNLFQKILNLYMQYSPENLQELE